VATTSVSGTMQPEAAGGWGAAQLGCVDLVKTMVGGDADPDPETSLTRFPRSAHREVA
jgi:hypothetical protein